MSSAASVCGDERFRLFCALTLPVEALDALEEWQREALAGENARLVGRDQLHVTLAFLGGRPAAEVQSIAGALRESVGAVVGELVFRPLRYRETRSVGMLVLEDEARLARALAEELHGRLERLGVYRREARPWLPHVTVLRLRQRSRLAPELPRLGEFSPSEAAVYHSVLRPTGAQYEVLDRIALGG